MRYFSGRFHRIFCGTILLGLCSLALAETCPRAIELRYATPNGWQALDSESNQPLSFKRESQFRRLATQFVLAEWTRQSSKPSIHCFYRDKTGSNLEAYLSKNISAAIETNRYWYHVSGHLQCAADTKRCAFKSVQPPTSTYLAKE